MSPTELMTGLPGEALVRQGLEDFQSGRCTIPACWVGMARSRLCRAGLLPASVPGVLADPELQLYRLLRQEVGDAYSRYNALVRELVSFEQALDRRSRAQAASGTPANGTERSASPTRDTQPNITQKHNAS